MVIQMREGPLPPLAETGTLTTHRRGRGRPRHREHPPELADHGGGGDAARPGRPDRDLATILHSIEIWRSQSLHSQGYLRYIEGFMKKLGVSVRQVTPDLEPLPEPEEDPLLLTGGPGSAEGDKSAEAEFAAQVESCSARAGGARDRRLPAVAGRDRGHGRRPSPPGVRHSWPSGLEGRDGVNPVFREEPWGSPRAVKDRVSLVSSTGHGGLPEDHTHGQAEALVPRRQAARRPPRRTAAGRLGVRRPPRPRPRRPRAQGLPGARSGSSSGPT